MTEHGRTRARLRAVLVLVALAAGGCSILSGPERTPTRFFVLTSRTPRAEKAPAVDVALGVGPLSFPSYLERPQMVSRKQPNQIAVSGTDRWAEPLRDGFLRVLAEDLGKVLGTSKIVMYPWYKTPLAYQIKLEVLRFEPVYDGEVVLQVIWTVYQPAKDRYLATHHEDLHRPAQSDDPETVARAMSELVGDLAQKIAGVIRRLR